jgi:hypothetical protein
MCFIKYVKENLIIDRLYLRSFQHIFHKLQTHMLNLSENSDYCEHLELNCCMDTATIF